MKMKTGPDDMMDKTEDPHITDKKMKNALNGNINKTNRGWEISKGTNRTEAKKHIEKALADPRVFSEPEPDFEDQFKKITGDTSKEDLIMELVKMKSLALEQENAMKGMMKAHEQVKVDVKERFKQVQEDIHKLKDKDENILRVAQLSTICEKKDEEIEHLKGELKRNKDGRHKISVENEKHIRDFDKVSKELDEANKLIGQYQECSQRDLKASPEDLEDYQEELIGNCEEKDEEINRLEDYEEASDKLSREFGLHTRNPKIVAEWMANTIWEKDSELEELRDQHEETMESHTALEKKMCSAKKTMEKFRESIEMMKRDMGLLQQSNEIWEKRCAEAKLKNRESGKENLMWGFNLWREHQCEVNPQYSIEDEVRFLLDHDTSSDNFQDAKAVFEELYTDKKLHRPIKGTEQWDITDLDEEDE